MRTLIDPRSTAIQWLSSIFGEDLTPYFGRDYKQTWHLGAIEMMTSYH
jgi:hypothetical protein